MKSAVWGVIVGMMAAAYFGAEGAMGMEAGLHGERAPVGKGWIAYEDSGGSGPVVLCMPGMGDLRGEFRFLAPLLRQAGYRVLLADLRGQGDSSMDFERYSSADSGDDALAVLDHAGVSRATLIGCSMSGGSIAWAAAKAPERVEALVMLAPFARDHGQSPFQRRMSHLLYRMVFARPWGPSVWGQAYATLYRKHKPQDFKDYQSSLVAKFSEPGRIEVLQALMGSSHKPVGERLGSVKAPTLILMGGADPDFPNPRQEGETLQRMLGGKSRLEVLEGLGHYPHVEDPQAVWDLIRLRLPELTHGT